MSTNLNWYLLPARLEKIGSGDNTLKNILARRFSDNDGSIPSSFTLDVNEDREWLLGVYDAGIMHAPTLYNDLIEHEKLLIKIEE